MVDLLDDDTDDTHGSDGTIHPERRAAAGSLPPRPRPPSRRRALPPLGAVAGAFVAVAGVALGIGTLLWATQAPDVDPTAAEQAVSAGPDSFGDEPAVALPDEATPEPAEPAPAEPAPAQPASPEPVPAEPAPPAPPVPAEQPPADPEPEAATAPPPVLVLNNSRISGLAAQAAADFEAGGWPVRDTGSLRGRIRATTVYYPPGELAAAQEFARRFPAVQRVLPRLDGLPGSGLTVVVTRDLA